MESCGGGDRCTGSRCLPARRPVGGERTAAGREEEKRRFLLPSESDVWHRESSSEDEVLVVFGAELDCGKRGEGDHWEQVSTS